MKTINKNYSVDSEGNDYSRPRPGTKGGVLSSYIGAKGYPVVALSPSRIPIKVHRLVEA